MDGYTPDLLAGVTPWPFGGLRRRWYRVILADPPWHFALHSSRGEGKAPQRHYCTMPLAEIQALPVADLAHPDGCALALWATAPMIREAQATLTAWGFGYSTMGTWAKLSRTGECWAFGTGYVLRSAAEFYLIGRRGRPELRARNVRNLIVAPVREHSRKPDELRGDLTRLFRGPRCELFARETVRGWAGWGDQATHFDPRQEDRADAARAR